MDDRWRGLTRAWFARQQPVLLGLANHWATGAGLRRVLGLPDAGRLLLLTPSAAHLDITGRGRYARPTHQAVCYPGASHAMRLHQHLGWLLGAVHRWDMATRFAPAWNLGCDSYTGYPDANPETHSVDGRVTRSGVAETWGTIRAGAGTGAADTGTSWYAGRILSDVDGAYSENHRGICGFYTAELGAGATVTAGTLTLYNATKSDNSGTPPGIRIVGATPASLTALVAADYGQVGATWWSDGTVAYASLSSSGNAWTLNATALAAVAVTGTTFFGVKTAVDYAGGDPGFGPSKTYNVQTIGAEDTVNTTKHPKLVLTYTPAATRVPWVIFI